MLKKTVIFDIDGTLADNTHRQHLVTGGNRNWEQFFREMGEDHPIEHIIELCQDLYSLDKYEILILSGRPERYRQLTERWLAWNTIPPLPLLMRDDGDVRPDDEVKEEILHSLQAQGKTISFVIDDRKSVVQMWRRNGIPCLQCAEGDF